MIEGLEMERLPGTIWVGPKSSFYKKVAEADLTHRRGEGRVTTEAEVGVM